MHLNAKLCLESSPSKPMLSSPLLAIFYNCRLPAGLGRMSSQIISYATRFRRDGKKSKF